MSSSPLCEQGKANHVFYEIVFMYKINACTSEPNYQYENYAEHHVAHIKDVTNRVLTFTGAPSNLWSLCLMYIVYILNSTANSSIGNISPHQHLCGQIPDISPALCF